MKKTLSLVLLLAAISLPAVADTIIFKDGMRVDAPKVWKSNGEVKCEIGGIVFGYPKSDVARIVKGSDGGIQAAAPVKKVPDSVTVVPETQTASSPKDKPVAIKKPAILRQQQAAAKKQTGVPKKETSVSRKQALPVKKEVLAFKKPAAVFPTAASIPQNKKKVLAKQIPGSKKIAPKKAVATQHARIPSFKLVINEDDNNSPIYIKRRRVLLVPRGLAKTQIRALLLSYEKKLRNELNAQKARYKVIVVWAYDDYDRADEGAGGWVGMISNEQKSGKLSENPDVRLK